MSAPDRFVPVSRRLPTDPVLPQLRTALDATAMMPVFARLLSEQGAPFEISGCAVDRIKYHPRRNLMVSYRLQLRDVHGARLEQLAAARFCGNGESATRHAKNLTRASTTSHGLRPSRDEALDMVAAWWPDDPKLGRASQWLGAPSAQRESGVGEVVAALTQGQGELVAHTVTLAQVVAEHRACARVRLTYRPRRGAVPVQRTVYAKADTAHDGGVIHAMMRTLSGSSAARSGALRIPETVLWQPDPGLHWVCEVPGRALLDAAAPISLDACAQVGALLAALHGTPVAMPRRISIADLLSRQRQVADTLELVEPRFGAQVRRLATRLGEDLVAFGDAPERTLHGDVHPGNLLVNAGQVTLIDLDGMRRGPAMLDLGDWIADALYRSLLAGADLAGALKPCRAFAAAYGDAARATVDERSLALSTANSLLCQRAWRAVVNLKPGRYELVEPLLDLARRIAEAGSIDAAQDAQRLAA